MKGGTDPTESPSGTIRGDLGLDLGRNVIHGSGHEAPVRTSTRPRCSSMTPSCSSTSASTSPGSTNNHPLFIPSGVLGHLRRPAGTAWRLAATASGYGPLARNSLRPKNLGEKLQPTVPCGRRRCRSKGGGPPFVITRAAAACLEPNCSVARLAVSPLDLRRRSRRSRLPPLLRGCHSISYRSISSEEASINLTGRQSV